MRRNTPKPLEGCIDRLICILIFLCIPISPFAAEADVFTEAFALVQATNQFNEALTTNDVPEKWRTSLQDKSTETHVSKVFFRGTNVVLEVGWRKGRTGVRTNFFHATIYNGETEITRVVGLSDSTVVMPPKHSEHYAVSTFIKMDGHVSVEVRDDKGYYEFIEVRGKETRPMDGLAYMRSVYSMQSVERVVERMTREMGKNKPGNTKP